MSAIALLVKESLSWLIKVVTTPRNNIQLTIYNRIYTIDYKLSTLRHLTIYTWLYTIDYIVN